MKKLSKVLGLKTPFRLYDEKGNRVYYENSNGYWVKRKYDEQGTEVYYENSNGYWVKRKYDEQGTEVYREDSNGYWVKRKYDEQGTEVYYEDSKGNLIDNRPKHTIVIDGKEIKLSEESYQELAKQFKE